MYLPLCLLLKDNTRKLWKECYKYDKFSSRKVDVQQSSIFGIAFICCFYRKFAFCICYILCTCYPLLHPLSSRSGVQKMCRAKIGPLKQALSFYAKPGNSRVRAPEGAPQQQNPNFFPIGEGFGFFVFFGKQNESLASIEKRPRPYHKKARQTTVRAP